MTVMKEELPMRTSLLWAGGGLIVLLGSAALAGSLGHPSYASGSPLRTTVYVTGTSSSSTAATEADISLGVQTTAATAQAALGQNNAVIARVLKALARLGVPHSALATSNLSVYPQYGSHGQVTGYQVADDIDVTLHHLGLVGPVLDHAVQAGANQVNGVTFSAGSEHSAYEIAYGQALANAKAQAEAIAAGLHEHVLEAVSVHVQGQGQGPEPLMFTAAAKQALAPNTPVFSGQQTVTVSLQVQYRLGP
jgi:uncharacterized protein YggE